MKTAITIPAVGETAPFSFDLGLLQGDPESSKSFDAIVGSVLDRLADQWTTRGYGFVLKESCERFLYASLADNIFVFQCGVRFNSYVAGADDSFAWL